MIDTFLIIGLIINYFVARLVIKRMLDANEKETTQRILSWSDIIATVIATAIPYIITIMYISINVDNKKVKNIFIVIFKKLFFVK